VIGDYYFTSLEVTVGKQADDVTA